MKAAVIFVLPAVALAAALPRGVIDARKAKATENIIDQECLLEIPGIGACTDEITNDMVISDLQGCPVNVILAAVDCLVDGILGDAGIPGLPGIPSVPGVPTLPILPKPLTGLPKPNTGLPIKPKGGSGIPIVGDLPVVGGLLGGGAGGPLGGLTGGGGAAGGLGGLTGGLGGLTGGLPGLGGGLLGRKE